MAAGWQDDVPHGWKDCIVARALAQERHAAGGRPGVGWKSGTEVGMLGRQGEARGSKVGGTGEARAACINLAAAGALLFSTENKNEVNDPALSRPRQLACGSRSAFRPASPPPPSLALLPRSMGRLRAPGSGSAPLSRALEYW